MSKAQPSWLARSDSTIFPTDSASIALNRHAYLKQTVDQRHIAAEGYGRARRKETPEGEVNSSGLSQKFQSPQVFGSEVEPPRVSICLSPTSRELRVFCTAFCFCTSSKKYGTVLTFITGR
jgi:hypothetical protein